MGISNNQHYQTLIPSAEAAWGEETASRTWSARSRRESGAPYPRGALAFDPGLDPGEAYVFAPGPPPPETARRGGDAEAAPPRSTADAGTTLPNTGARCWWCWNWRECWG